MMQQHRNKQSLSIDTIQSCPDGKYWVRPHERKKINKQGKVYIEHVKGYCCCYHNPFDHMAEDQKIPTEHLYFALTVYGEARSENEASKRAIAWIIRNRLTKKRWGTSYREIVLKPAQFSCWKKNDPNYKRLQNPGNDGSAADKLAWQRCKKLYEEIQHASEAENPLPGVCHYFSGPPNPKIPWEKHYFDLPDVPRFHFAKLDK